MWGMMGTTGRVKQDKIFLLDTHIHTLSEHKNASIHKHKPWEEDAFDHIEVLHQHISLRLGAEVANSISNSQLDGPFQGRRGGLEVGNSERNNRKGVGGKLLLKSRCLANQQTIIKNKNRDR